MNTQKLCFFDILAITFILSACGNGNSIVVAFGETVDTLQSFPSSELAVVMSVSPTFNGVVSGKVIDVCKAEGCWLKMESGKEKPLLVRMKDHSFNVTENVVSKFAFVSGQAHYDTLSIEKLRDYAKDNEESDAEINGIIQPEYELVFEASGIVAR